MRGIYLDWKAPDEVIQRSDHIVITNASYSGVTCFYINWLEGDVLIFNTWFHHPNHIDRNRALSQRILKAYEGFRDYFQTGAYQAEEISKTMCHYIKRLPVEAELRE